MNYSKIYNLLVDKAKNRASTKREALSILGYCEVHHIIPKCMEGSNSKENLIYFSAREHFVAHQLLVKIYPNEKGLIFACVSMSWDRYGQRVNNRTYEWIKRKNSLAQSERQKKENIHNSERVRKCAETQRGKSKPKVSEALTGRNSQNDPSIMLRTLAKHGRPNPGVSKALTGRTKENFEYLAIMSEKRKKENLQNSERCRKQSKAMKGRTKHNNNSVKSMAEKLNVLDYDTRTQLISLKQQNLSFKEIHEQFTKSNIKIAYSTLVAVYYRELKDRNINEI